MDLNILLENVMENRNVRETDWKYELKTVDDLDLPDFMGEPVQIKDGCLKFDFLEMLYDPEFNILIIDDDEIELNSKFKWKNSEMKQLLEEKNTSDYKITKILTTLRNYVRKMERNSEIGIPNLIFQLVETKEVGIRNNDLIQAVKNLLFDAELRKTYCGFVLPQKNNVCRPVDIENIIKFICDVTGIQGISSKTVKESLTYFNDEAEPEFNCIVTANGYYDFNEQEFFESSSEPIVIKKYSPYNYRVELIGEDAPPILKQFLLETFSDDLSKITQFLEITGYLLTDGNPYQILPHFDGIGRNGKSLCTDLAGNLVNNQTSNVDIFTVDFKSKYSAPLIESNLNIINEIKGVKNLPEVKEFLGGAGLSLSRIYEHERKYSDKELPKSILATNNFKNLNNNIDYALVRRLNVWIEFKNVVPEDKQDPKLLEKILNEPDSMDWLLTNSIEAFVSCGGKFHAEHSAIETEALLNKYIDPLNHIIEDKFYYDLDEYKSLADNATENWGRLVSTEDIIESLGYLGIGERIFKDNRSIRRVVGRVFDLNYNKWDSRDDYVSGQFGTERIHNYDLNIAKYAIVGLIRKPALEDLPRDVNLFPIPTLIDRIDFVQF